MRIKALAMAAAMGLAGFANPAWASQGSTITVTGEIIDT